MRAWDAAVLGASLGGFIGSAVFLRLAYRACSRAMDALAEARRIHDGVDRLLERNLDTISRVEEFTL